MLSAILWLIPALPLVAAVSTAALGPRVPRATIHRPCVIACLASFALSLVALLAVIFSDDAARHVTTVYHWITVGSFDIPLALRLDPLTAVMLVVVTLVGSAVAVYSTAYMQDDPGYFRFFAEISLFVFSMTMLVLASNFLLLYVFWEAVGLCSYLLIGFWYERPAAAAAGMKAFLVNRVGDLGFAVGILLIWVTFGTLDFDRVLAPAAVAAAGPAAVTAICLLLFCGAVGKSAQFPLHVWLPDAMEGPSPVSALIHAATMVTAGVYMVARCTPLFAAAPGVRFVVALIGCFTALLAAAVAVTQTDLKRILAYSTVSQLGYMFLGLGVGSTAAVVAAMFHLFTHAFFKGLLFLAAGSVMHAMGGVIDLRRFGGLRRLLPTTHWTFLCGAAALAGFPFLSGFWSKDEILAAVRHAHGPDASWFALFYWAATFTAFLTAFYTFRAYFKTFWGTEKLPDEADRHHIHEPKQMMYPLMVLAAGAVGAGLLFGPTGLFLRFLDDTPQLRVRAPTATETASPPEPAATEHASAWTVMATSALVALAGIALAYVMYGRPSHWPEALAGALRPLYKASSHKFWIDELYEVAIVWPLLGLALVLRYFDLLVIDGLVNRIGWSPSSLGRVLRPVQNGLVQFYALAMILGLTVLVLAMVLTAR